jgi:hypothetical protein
MVRKINQGEFTDSAFNQRIRIDFKRVGDTGKACGRGVKTNTPPAQALMLGSCIIFCTISWISYLQDSGFTEGSEFREKVPETPKVGRPREDYMLQSSTVRQFC